MAGIESCNLLVVKRKPADKSPLNCHPFGKGGGISKTVMEKRKPHLILLFESKTQEVSLEGNQNILRY